MSGNFTQSKIKEKRCSQFLGKTWGLAEKDKTCLRLFLAVGTLLLQLTHHDAPLSHSRDGQSRPWIPKVINTHRMGKACTKILTVYRTAVAKLLSQSSLFFFFFLCIALAVLELAL